MPVKFSTIVEEDYKIIVETSSLIHKNSKNIFVDKIAPILTSFGRYIILPVAVYNDICRINNNNTNKILAKFINANIIKSNKDYDNHNTHDAIIDHFIDLRLTSNLCLITNNKPLAKEIRLLQISHHNKYIKTFYITGTDVLEYDDNNSWHFSNGKCIPPACKFNLCSTPRTNDVLLHHTVPQEHDYILDNNNQRHYLQKELGKGGEGIAYLTDSGYVCKIYKEINLTVFKERKTRLLIEHNIRVRGVCIPELIACNSQGQFVGYLMPKVEGKAIKPTLTIPDRILKSYPSWNKLQLVNIAINILDKIQQLHNHNIILGDINPLNIFFADDQTVYFIDTDSYQIEDYPCPVGNIQYTRPEHHATKNYKTYLRTKQDDIFAVSVLTFMLMVLGKPPYAHVGGGTIHDNMKLRKFPYNLTGRGKYIKVPEGPWIYAWSHLSYGIKDVFFSLFRENKQITLEELISAFKKYQKELKTIPQLNKEIRPTYFKKVDKNGKPINTTSVCENCHKSFTYPTKGKRKYCDECKKILFARCKECGKSFKIDPSNDQYEYCDKHWGDILTCVDCGEQFLFNMKDQKFFNKKGYPPPIRCPQCRSSR